MSASDPAAGAGSAGAVHIMRASARPWARLLGVSATLLVAGVALLLSDVVAPGALSSIVAVGVIVAFLATAASAAAMTARWRTSLQVAQGFLVVRTPLGAKAISIRDGVGFVRWLDPRSMRPVIWVVERQMLVVPVSERLHPLRVEAFALAMGMRVDDLDDPPSAQRSLGRDTPD